MNKKSHLYYPKSYTFVAVFFNSQLKRKISKQKIDMKKISLILIAALTIVSLDLQAQNWYGAPDERGIYGEDGRAEAKSKWEYRDYMRATCTVVPQGNIDGNKLYCSTLRGRLSRKWGVPKEKMGSSIKFGNQHAAGFCTGFLIAPDILVTAGHCVDNENDLKTMRFIFDYTNDLPFTMLDKEAERGYVTFNTSNLYMGTKLLGRMLSENSSEYDYAVILLDRPTSRKPFKFRTGGAVKQSDFLAMIGSPTGLPLKVADSARVTNDSNAETFFYTDLDVFGGNSGGPVFNSNGWIEGILVRGPGDDYYVDENGYLQTDVLFDLYSYIGWKARSGNAVHRITHIPVELIKLALYRNNEYAIVNNNLGEFLEWSVYKWIWSENIANKTNLLLLAAQNNRQAFLDTILKIKGINPNIKDAYGKGFIHYLVGNGDVNNLRQAGKIANFDVNQTEGYGNTALHLAAASGNEEMVRLLLGMGADLKAKNNGGKTARSVAKDRGHKSIAKLLKRAEKGKSY